MKNQIQKEGTPLSQVNQLTSDDVQALGGIWITTVEEFVITAHEENGLAGLAEVLNSSPQEIEAIANDLLPLIPKEIQQQMSEPNPEYATGAWDEPEPQSREIAVRSLDARVALPEQVSLINQLPPVRNQGRRGTCVAHACTALRESLSGDSSIDLSEQFLYWAARQQLVTPLLKNRPGALLLYGMQALKESGICPESDWPYQSDPNPGDEDQGEPPKAIQDTAQTMRIKDFRFVWPRNINVLKTHLSEGRVIAFTLPIFKFWNTLNIRRSGAVRMPLVSDGSLNPITWLESAHAMAMVGYQDSPSTPGGGYFMVRNSWGDQWGAQCPDGPGYGWIPYEYLRKFGLTAFIVE